MKGSICASSSMLCLLACVVTGVGNVGILGAGCVGMGDRVIAPVGVLGILARFCLMVLGRSSSNWRCWFDLGGRCAVGCLAGVLGDSRFLAMFWRMVCLICCGRSSSNRRRTSVPAAVLVLRGGRWFRCGRSSPNAVRPACGLLVRGGDRGDRASMRASIGVAGWWISSFGDDANTASNSSFSSSSMGSSNGASSKPGVSMSNRSGEMCACGASS